MGKRVEGLKVESQKSRKRPLLETEHGKLEPHFPNGS
jgi:hypothetical protein